MLRHVDLDTRDRSPGSQSGARAKAESRERGREASRSERAENARREGRVGSLGEAIGSHRRFGGAR